MLSKTSKGKTKIPKSNPEPIHQEEDDDLVLRDVPEQEDDDGQRQSDHNLPMIKAFKVAHIRHRVMFRFTNERQNKQRGDYPTTWPGRCIKCLEPLEGQLPVFPPVSYDEKRGLWMLSVFPTCSMGHAKEVVLGERTADMHHRLALLSRFGREFLGLPPVPVGCLPLSAKKSVSPFGYLDDDEYANKSTRVSGVVRHPPYLFVDTWMEETDIQERERERQKRNSILNSISATPQQQSKFQENLERVIQQSQSKRSNIMGTPIAKKMGFLKRK